MKRTLISLSLMVFPFCAHCEPQEDTPPAITVYTQFEGDHSEISVDEMKKELAAMMDPIGLRFDWRSLEMSRGNEVSVELVVVTFKGDCQMDGLRARGSEGGPLGWTHMSDGDVLPFSDVQCDRIRRFINPQIRTSNQRDRDRIYGRAMARVLAHELYHVFTNTTRHSAWGVAKAFYTPHELVADDFVFQQKESQVLRNGKLKSLLHGGHATRNTFTGQ